MTTDLDGIEIDLDRVQVALDGSRWLWTCDHSAAGDPLMLRMDANGAAVLPLPEVYGQHGPLMAAARPTTAAMYRQVLEAAS